MVEIICIHLTNRYGHDVGIKYSRFNHSCSPNAYNGEKEIRAFQKIKAGEEISVTYKLEVAMKNLGTRQETLHKHYGFTCGCELCHNEVFKNDEETYEKYHKLEVRIEAKHLRLCYSITCNPLPQYLWKCIHSNRTLQEIF